MGEGDGRSFFIVMIKKLAGKMAKPNLLAQKVYNVPLT